MNHILTRIAPTPSGFLHLGNAFSFLLTRELAKKYGAKILLRIDDLDRERYRREYAQDIFDTLDFLEIEIDLGPKSVTVLESEWSQMHRMPLYEAALVKLSESKLIFSCDCSRNKIQKMDSRGYYLGQCLDRKIPLSRPETFWRINTLDSDFIEFSEYPNQKKTDLIPEETGFYVVRKKDKLPSYHLTSVVDDLHFGVDLIVRGKDLYASTLAQLDLGRMLKQSHYAQATFLHHDVLMGPNQTKLSKSAGDTSIQYLRKEGKKLKDIFRLLRKMVGKLDEIHASEDFLRLFT